MRKILWLIVVLIAAVAAFVVAGPLGAALVFLVAGIVYVGVGRLDAAE